MRRVLLTLTLIALAGWSQPAQPQAQPPIVAQVQMPPPPPRDFLGYLQSFGPLIAASIAVGTALMQYYLQQQQMMQQLFDKRFTVYTTVEGYLASVTTGDNEGKEKLYGSFTVATRHAEFLFGPEVLRFINSFHALEYERNCHPEGDDKWCEATLELTRRVTDEVEPLFRPYLQLHHEHSWLGRFIARVNRWVDADQPAVMASRYDA